jgi:purine nucleoside permease
MKILKMIALIFFVFSTLTANAEDLLGYLTDSAGKYIGPSVEDNILIMDTDKNGFADVTEVRAYLALKHGKDYQKAVLDRWEVQSLGGGCPVPFAKEFYSDSQQ